MAEGGSGGALVGIRGVKGPAAAPGRTGTVSWLGQAFQKQLRPYRARAFCNLLQFSLSVFTKCMLSALLPFVKQVESVGTHAWYKQALGTNDAPAWRRMCNVHQSSPAPSPAPSP